MFFCAVGMSQQYKVYGEADGIIPQSFLKINQEKSGALTFWGMNNKTGLTRWDGEKWTYLKFKHDPKLTQSKILSNKDGHVFVRVLENDSIDLLSSFYIDAQWDKYGNLWVHDLGYQSHLFKIVGKEWVDIAKIPFNLNGNAFNDDGAKMFIDSKNNIWIPSPGGLLMYTGDSLINITQKYKLKVGYCSIMEDHGGNIWISTRVSGIYKYDGRSCINYTIKDGLFSDNVCSTIIDKKGTIWAAHYRGGVSSFDGNRWTNFSFYDHFPEIKHNIDASRANADQDSYIITGGGLYSFPGKMIVDSLNHIWFECKGCGILIYDVNKWELVKSINNLSTTEMIMDSKGNLWFSNLVYNWPIASFEYVDFTGSIFKYDINTQKIVIILEGKNIYDLFEDKQGNIWGNTVYYGKQTYGKGKIINLFPVEIYCFSNE
jgi:hypothetical protein